jgi:serine/threonine protein kinase
MNNPRGLHEDEPTDDDDELRRCDLADQYWSDLQGNSCPDSRKWLGERHIEDPTLIDDLEVISLFQRLSQSPVATGAGSKEFSLSATRTLDNSDLEPTLHFPRSSSGEIANATERPERIGRYLVTGEPLGEGGQGQVFRGVHPALGTGFVLKLGRKPIAADSAEHDALVREGQILASCKHPNLVRVVDLDFHEGRPFVVMEDVHGRTLHQYAIDQHPRPREAARLVSELTRAVTYLHSRGIIHQDIKPNNILIDENGKPRLIDLGLARRRQIWADDATGSIGGTAAYMSPEQALGREDRIGPRTDVFGLGGVLYYLLASRPVYHSTTQYGLLRQARRGEQVAPRQVNPRVPRGLERICQKALAPDLDRRYRTADELGRSLRFYLRRNVLVTAALLVLTVPAALYGILSSRPPAAPAVSSSTVGVGIPRINSFDVKHFRGNNPPQSLGVIGMSSWSTLLDDDVRVHASLDAAAHCRLIALNPDGSVQFCPPTSDAAPQADVDYPLGELYFPLTDGAGWQTFVLLVSRKPFPLSAEWDAHIRKLWKPVPVDLPDCVWKFDGRSYEPVCRESRGAPRELAAVPRVFEEVCEYFKSLPDVDAIRAVAFAVRPK